MESSFYKGAELPEVMVSAYAAKARYSTKKIILLAIMAGIFIGLGGMISGIASHSGENFGTAKFIAGAIFPVGLIMVVMSGSELFTGNVMMMMPVIDKRIKAQDYLKNIILVWIFNLVGSALLSFIADKAGIFELNGGLYGAYLMKIASGKVGLSFSRAFFSGILCNVMVCAAVYLAMAAKEIPGKILTMWFVICGFVIAGFEHCVANMYYLTGALFAKGNPMIVEQAKNINHLTDDKIALLNIQGMFKNLLPVTLGNWVGGVLFIGVVFYIAYGVNKQDTIKTVK